MIAAMGKKGVLVTMAVIWLLAAAVSGGSLKEMLLLKLQDTNLAQEASNRRRRRRRSKAKGSTSEICQWIYQQDFASKFSACKDEESVQGQGGFDCSAPEMQNYQACAGEPACSWWHLSGVRKCMANPCYRINQGLCTIQNTGGRCVWYTKEQNKEVHGKNNPGCYKSPCSNPLDNTKRGCKKKSNKFYKCVWCDKYQGQAYGCMNAKKTSTAQCWNIQGTGASGKCVGCTEEGPVCTSDKCRKNCCESPLCTCLIDDFRNPDNEGNNIILP